MAKHILMRLPWRSQALALLNLAYGINADLTIGAEWPWAFKKNAAFQGNGVGDLKLFSKYRLWHNDAPGMVDAISALLKVKFDTSKSVTNIAKPALGTGSTDVTLGLTYGHESLTWYRWASMRYRRNGHSGGQKLGDKLLFDLAIGWRANMPEYLKSDMVWLLELNTEYGRRGSINGLPNANNGGTEIFLAPGFMWTIRNFAVRAGIQIPVFSHLNGTQSKSDYRAKLELEWHL